MDERRNGRRGGRPRLGAGKRRPALQVWLDPQEEQRIAAAAAAAGMPPGRFVRRAALGRQVVAIPPVVNLSAWRELARLAANVNQIATAVNCGRVDIVGAGLSRLLSQVGLEVASLRAQLLGADTDDQADDDAGEAGWSGS